MRAAVLPALFLTALGLGCARDPLVGAWTAATASGQWRFTTTLTFTQDGLLVVDAGTGSCTGARRYAGLQWSRTASTLTFSGRAACSGAITCAAAGASATLGCPEDASSPRYGACGYSLSDDGNTLTLTDCSGGGGPTTYTRSAE